MFILLHAHGDRVVPLRRFLRLMLITAAFDRYAIAANVFGDATKHVQLHQLFVPLHWLREACVLAAAMLLYGYSGRVFPDCR